MYNMYAWTAVLPYTGATAGTVWNKNTRGAQTSAKADPVRIRSPDPDDFHNLMETSLSTDTSAVKFS